RFSRDWSSDVCSSDLYEVTVNVANAAQLNFSQQPPSSTEYGSNFTSDVIVQIEDEYGNLVTDATDEVVLSLTDDPDGVAIVGTRSEERRVGKECGSGG